MSMFVNARSLAKIMDLSERRINQLISTGIINKVDDGQINVFEAIKSYLNNKSRINFSSLPRA